MNTTRLHKLMSLAAAALILAASVPAVQTVSGNNLRAEGDNRVFLPLIQKTPSQTWNTFLGSSGLQDEIQAIAVTEAGDVYVAGESEATWGAPLNSFVSGGDVFIAKLNSSGTLVWNTFLGSADYDFPGGIAVDGNGDIVVSGGSKASWGTPANPYSGGYDAFVAKTNSDGALLWNTFLGSGGFDASYSVALNLTGDIYVTGYSAAAWGAPVHSFLGGGDGFAAKLNSSGARVWNTFLGSRGYDTGNAIAADANGDVYVTGYSNTAMGGSVNSFVPGGDAFITKLNGSGSMIWNTLVGSSAGDDDTSSIAVDENGYVYVAGWSDAAWGTPVNPFAGDHEAFAAKLNTSSGALVWSTFLGSAGYDIPSGIAVDGNGDIYVTGSSDAAWGAPANPYQGQTDAFVARTNNNGSLMWNTFLGSTETDRSECLDLDNKGNIYLAGASDATWGTPVNPYNGSFDAFVAKIRP